MKWNKRKEFEWPRYYPYDKAKLRDKFIAKVLQLVGVRPTWSTGIHGYLTRGYGDLDANGFWKYPLPDGEYVG